MRTFHDELYDFNFHVVNFPYLYNNANFKYCNYLLEYITILLKESWGSMTDLELHYTVQHTYMKPDNKFQEALSCISKKNATKFHWMDGQRDRQRY